MAEYTRYLVMNGAGNVMKSFDGDGVEYSDGDARTGAMREASMMTPVGVVVPVQVPDPYDGESDASADVSATDSGTSDDGNTVA